MVAATWWGIGRDAAFKRANLRASATQRLEDSISHRLLSLQFENRALHALMTHSALSSNVHLVGLVGGRVADVDLGAGRGPILIYSLDPRCGTCYATLPFTRVLAQAQGCRPEVFHVLIAASRLYPDSSRRRDAGAGVNVLSEPKGTAWRTLPLARPGSLILIARSGAVVGMWLGPLDRSLYPTIRTLTERSCDAASVAP